MPQRWYRSLLSGAVVLALVAGVTGSASAQNATVISGKVVGRGAAPIVGATVHIDGTQLGTLTGNDGGYVVTVPGGRTGTVTVTARLIGYRMVKSPVTLNGL